MSQPIQPPPRSRREKILTLGLIIVGIFLTIFFGMRAVRSFMRIELEPGTVDVQAIQGWMTVPYIAIAYDVPEEYIFEQLGIPQEGNQAKGLYGLNRQYFEGEHKAILKVIQEAITQYQVENPPPNEVDKD